MQIHTSKKFTSHWPNLGEALAKFRWDVAPLSYTTAFNLFPGGNLHFRSYFKINF